MKLLIITQVVDTQHPVLGFFHRWVIEFAKYVEHLHVIALQVGEYDLPENVTVYSLGKEDGVSKFEYIRRFYSYIWRYRNEYDSIFVHMNQVYVLLGAFLWRLLGKKVGLWYVHKQVSTSLQFAVAFVDYVFTTSPESFRIKTKKRLCVGHGIDTNQFKIFKREESDALRIVTTGRVSKTKRIQEMVNAVESLVETGNKASLTVVGSSATKEDEVYEKQIQEDASSAIIFTGPVAHDTLPKILSEHDVFINLSETGSMDKAVLEALSTGMPVVTTNKAYKDLLSTHGLFIENTSPEVTSKALLRAKAANVRTISEEVRKTHSITSLIKRLTQIYEKS